ncbi:uncharacterized protein LOC129243603 isoform X1 [Anastrepha obliqua]|uniref:uncharacterized protein LOC129243603 isoform X1 n=1 Tax=Anastrepha obliqua TaxID=95512 RepID=UPI0024093CDC|nr:uncharacterized protein LOC129243603 isoform X1 [Anastrepha obliqua]
MYKKRYHKKHFTHLHAVQNYQVYKGKYKHFKRFTVRKERWFIHDQNFLNKKLTEENSYPHRPTTTTDFQEAFLDAFYESNELKKPIIRDLFTQQNLTTSKETPEDIMPITTDERLLEGTLVEGSFPKCVRESVNANIYLQQTTFDNSSTPIINSALPKSTIEFPTWIPKQSSRIANNINSAAMEHPLKNFDNHSADPYIIIDLNGLAISSKELGKIMPIS